MSTGVWIAAGTLFGFGGFAFWIATTRQRVKGRAWKAALLLSIGTAMAVFAYWSDASLRRETLFEIVAEGSIGAVPGTPAVERHFSFEVIHPGVEHRLVVYPEYPAPTARRGSFDAEVRVRVLDGSALVLLDGQGVHEPYARQRYWNDQRYTFVPTSKGRHTLVLIPITSDIPAVHARIVDPLGVPDDRRASGY